MPAELSSLLRLEVPVIVQIAERPMPLADVVGIRHGSIIELPKRIDDDLEILVNDRVVGTGKAVKVGEHFGVRVRSIGAMRDRVNALGNG
ncbi:MAG: FliM/FliN family flagellar motor switch protein [Phycisphaerales bacterium]